MSNASVFTYSDLVLAFFIFPFLNFRLKANAANAIIETPKIASDSSIPVVGFFSSSVLPVLIYLAGYGLAMAFCVPLSISNIWIEMNLAVFANLSTFLALVFCSQIHRLIKK